MWECGNNFRIFIFPHFLMDKIRWLGSLEKAGEPTGSRGSGFIF
jgi:hypothetical protein